MIPVPFVPAPGQQEIKLLAAFGLTLIEQICSSSPGDWGGSITWPSQPFVKEILVPDCCTWMGWQGGVGDSSDILDMYLLSRCHRVRMERIGRSKYWICVSYWTSWPQEEHWSHYWWILVAIWQRPVIVEEVGWLGILAFNWRPNPWSKCVWAWGGRIATYVGHHWVIRGHVLTLGVWVKEW